MKQINLDDTTETVILSKPGKAERKAEIKRLESGPLSPDVEKRLQELYSQDLPGAYVEFKIPRLWHILYPHLLVEEWAFPMPFYRQTHLFRYVVIGENYRQALNVPKYHIWYYISPFNQKEVCSMITNKRPLFQISETTGALMKETEEVGMPWKMHIYWDPHEEGHLITDQPMTDELLEQRTMLILEYDMSNILTD